MSRIGKRPIDVPKAVKVELKERRLHCSGPKGQIEFELPRKVNVSIADGVIQVQAEHETDKKAKAQMGTAQKVILNMVTGVSEGFTKRLQLNGVGYRASVQGTNMELMLGYSKPVQYKLPTGVAAQVEGNTLIVLSSHDRALLGQTAAVIRDFRPPEPFQGKGVRYEGEYVRRKAGKSGKK
jgi:large subunit ribosomal protein L6